MRASTFRDLGDVGSVGIHFVLSIVLCYLAGKWLDGRFFQDRGYATAVGALIGTATGFKAIYDVAVKAQRRLEELERQERAAVSPREKKNE